LSVSVNALRASAYKKHAARLSLFREISRMPLWKRCAAHESDDRKIDTDVMMAIVAHLTLKKADLRNEFFRLSQHSTIFQEKQHDQRNEKRLPTA
jgi:hypothetical protein